MKLKLKRLEKGLSLRSMAQKLNISVTTLRVWELEPKKVTIENAKKICVILKCELEDIDEWQR